MKNTLFLLIGTLALGLSLQAQTATPNTTLCAAQTATAGTVCLTSTTGIVNQAGIYVDQEYELVTMSNSGAVCSGPCYVTVTRNNRNAGSGPTAHANAALAWIAYTPANSVVPGSNGFAFGTNVTDIGPCTRTAQTYLPRIWVNRGIKRDCNGVWVDYTPAKGDDYPSPIPLTTIAANTALTVSSGNYALITKAGVIALTLAAPTAGSQDGMVITISANNGAYADTLTATSLLQTGGGSSPYTTATFGATTAYNGASLTLKAYGGFWFVIASQGVTFS